MPADDAQVQQGKWPGFKERKRRGCGHICRLDLDREERVGNPLTEGKMAGAGKEKGKMNGIR